MNDSKQDEFWADKVYRLKKQGLSEEVIKEARKHIPYPASFSEIVIAIRKDIRAKRKEGEDTKRLLHELYKWAVIENFFNHVDWGWIISDRTIHLTAHSIIEEIKAPYKTVGYKELGLLKKTDVKWLIEAFGEPGQHTNAKEANPELYEQAVEKFRVAREKDEQQWQRESDRLFGSWDELRSAGRKRTKISKSTGCLVMIVSSAGLIFTAALMMKIII